MLFSAHLRNVRFTAPQLKRQPPQILVFLNCRNFLMKCFRSNVEKETEADCRYRAVAIYFTG
jgi:hypothetical protein